MARTAGMRYSSRFCRLCRQADLLNLLLVLGKMLGKTCCAAYLPLSMHAVQGVTVTTVAARVPTMPQVVQGGATMAYQSCYVLCHHEWYLGPVTIVY